MPRTLIIADLHHRIAKADAILAYEPHDRVIFLGDTFDQFDDTPEDAHRSAVWLKASLANPAHTHLLGNHDLAYAYPFNANCYCSGFERAKDHAIWQVMDRADWDRAKLCWMQDGILFSHAGLSAKLLKRATGGTVKTLDETLVWLDAELRKVREAADVGTDHYLYACGWSRGGREPVGGLTWADFDIDMLPTSFGQIVGHTPHAKPDFCLREPDTSHLARVTADQMGDRALKDTWWTLDLDTNTHHYAVLEDGVLTIKEVTWTGDEIRYTHDVWQGPI